MDTFAIITVEPNKLIVEKTGHDRMPLIVKRTDWQRWLEPGSAEQPPIDLLRPFDAEHMKAWQVDKKINNVRNNGPELCVPVSDSSLFGDR
jgi:putative SOS response-associated peptidase YedK